MCVCVCVFVPGKQYQCNHCQLSCVCVCVFVSGKQYQCSHCNSTYGAERLLRDHMRYHGNYSTQCLKLPLTVDSVLLHSFSLKLFMLFMQDNFHTCYIFSSQCKYGICSREPLEFCSMFCWNAIMFKWSSIIHVFSSPEHKVLKVSFCDGPLSVVHRPSVQASTFFLKNSSSETANLILTKLHINCLSQLTNVRMASKDISCILANDW